MEATETEKTEATETEKTEASANGAAPPSTVKPWIAAGYKSRDEMRAAKGQKTAKPKTKKPVAVKADAAAKPVKSKAKKKAKPVKLKAASSKPKKVKSVKKLAAKGKSKDTGKSVADKRAAALRTAMFKKAMSKREEPNAYEKKVLQALAKGKESNIIDLAKKCFGSKPFDARYLLVKNALRWLVASKKFKQIGRGTYRRIA